MAKVLRVIKPFYVMEVGDTLQWDEESKMYSSKFNEDFHKSDDEALDLTASYSSCYEISEPYAKELIETGYLEEVVEDKKDKKFVNVFDEIQTMIDKYTDDLNNVQEDMAHLPECLKVERTTVLTNILSVLNHLNALKK